MNILLFNPEHDIALARNLANFTSPRAGRQLRADLGFLPALWAKAADAVVVDDVTKAKRSLEGLHLPYSDIHFIAMDALRSLPESLSINPWGWDKAIAHQLERSGIRRDAMPSEEQLEKIRQLSSRQFSSIVLPMIRKTYNYGGVRLVGESTYADNEEKLTESLLANSKSILKSPWSSSGRGIRRVGSSLADRELRWAENVIHQQGGIMVEPFYCKIADFGMEFIAEAGSIRYCGLSVFNTAGGAYTGNIVDDEAAKMDILAEHINPEAISSLKETIINVLQSYIVGSYLGPFGIDMMIVDDNGQAKIHPCVEINMRMTMGHVALHLSTKVNRKPSIMRIIFDGNHYQLTIQPQP